MSIATVTISYSFLEFLVKEHYINTFEGIIKGTLTFWCTHIGGHVAYYILLDDGSK